MLFKNTAITISVLLFTLLSIKLRAHYNLTINIKNNNAFVDPSGLVVADQFDDKKYIDNKFLEEYER